MNARRIKVIWGASNVIRGRWILGLVGFYTRRDGPREGGIAISVRGALLWSVVLAFVGWVALATAGFWIWQRNPYTLLTYADALLYPVRRAEIAEKNGQAYIAQGLDLARARKWQDAANLLRLGLARFPRDFRARLTLAEYYQLTNQRALALQTLIAGLGNDYPGRWYLDALFKLADQGEDFETVADVSARYLVVARRDGVTVDERWLVARRYDALTAAGRHAEALALAEAEGPGDLNEERRVLSMLAMGRSSEAIAHLAAWRGWPGANLTIIARLEVRAFREARWFDDMERALAELRQRSPGEPGTLVYGLVQQVMAGRAAAAGAALADFIFRFGGSVENLALAAAPLAEVGDLPLLERCTAAARERGFPLGRFQVLVIQTQLGRGEWDAAERTLGALPPATGKDPLEPLWREWVHRLIEAARNPAEVPQRALMEFLRSRLWSIKIYRQSMDAAMRADRLELARDILDMAMRAFPASKGLQTSAAEVKLEMMARTPAIAATPASSPLPRTSEAAFAERLDRLLLAREWTEAGRHIAQVEGLVSPPAWFGGQEPAIRLAQVRIAQAKGDLPAMSAAARLFLNGETARSQKLLEVAREAFGVGDKAGALTLAREIGWRTPEYAPAQRSLREWEPAATDQARRAEKDAAPALDEGAALLAQLRARRAAGDVPGLLAAARLLLTGDRDRAAQAIALAREWAAAGDPAAAEQLVREVLRRHETFPPARRLLLELTGPGAGRK